jgi:hypothetical protein
METTWITERIQSNPGIAFLYINDYKRQIAIIEDIEIPVIP